MLSMTFDVSGVNELQSKMMLALTALKNRTKPHTKARDYMKQRWTVNFDSQGSIYGKWRPMAAFTIEFHGPGILLNRTGNLRSGFLAQAASPTELSTDATIWNFRNSPYYLFPNAFGNPNVSSFAKIHGLGPVPARRLWGINGADEAKLKEIFEDYCNEVIARYLG